MRCDARCGLNQEGSLLRQCGRARLAAWGFAASTGSAEGYDASDVGSALANPGTQEIANTIDATLGGVPLPAGVTLPKPGADQTLTALKALLARPQPGVGASGLNFFNVPGVVAAEDRRDIVLRKSLADALAQLAGSAFAAAFGGSTNQNDYRWGKLHRIVFAHPLGGAFNLPTTHPLGNALPGLPSDGGIGSVDVAKFDPRANGANAFMFSRGPVNRFVAEAGRRGVRAESAWPGGTSGTPGNAFYSNLLPGYLSNDSVPLLFREGELKQATASVRRFVPAK